MIIIRNEVLLLDQEKIGAMLRKLRLQNNMTQKNLAEQLGLSPKTISKWECGQGCPDLAVLPELASILGVSMEDLLSGRLPEGGKNGGNMKNLNFYVFPTTGISSLRPVPRLCPAAAGFWSRWSIGSRTMPTP